HDADDRKRLTRDRGHRILELIDDADVDGRIVHVVLDALAEDDLQTNRVARASLDVRAEIESPAGRITREIELIGEDVIPFDDAQHACRPNVAPLLSELVRR